MSPNRTNEKKPNEKKTIVLNNECRLYGEIYIICLLLYLCIVCGIVQHIVICIVV